MDEIGCSGCGKRPEVFGSRWCAHCHSTFTETAKRRIIQLEDAVRWALGEIGEFGDEPAPLAGKYRKRFWWRGELRKRVFSDGENGRE